MDDLDGIPRKGQEPDDMRGFWKILKGMQRQISELQRSAAQRFMSLTDGGNLRIRGGGKVLVEDGGIMEITDDGFAVVRGQSIDPADGKAITASAALEAREKLHTSGELIRVPGFYFESAYGEGGSLTAENGGSPLLTSARKVPDPPGTPNRRGTYSRVQAADTAAIFGANAFDPDAVGAAQAKSYTSLVALPEALTFRLWDAVGGMRAAIDVSVNDSKFRFFSRAGMDVSGPFTVDGQPVTGGPAAGARISHYVATGAKGNYDAANQTIATPVYQPADSTANLGVPGNSQITITEAGIYSITLSITLYIDGTLSTIKPATGRSFMDIADGSGVAYSRTAIPVSEDQATGNHAGIYLQAGAVLKFNLLQTSGGTAWYRARIWITKHP